MEYDSIYTLKPSFLVANKTSIMYCTLLSMSPSCKTLLSLSNMAENVNIIILRIIKLKSLKIMAHKFRPAYPQTWHGVQMKLIWGRISSFWGKIFQFLG